MNVSTVQRASAALLVLSLPLLSACEFVAGFIGQSPEDQLAEVVTAAWASSGSPFMEGRFSRDSIGAVTPTGDRSRNVTIPDAGTEEWAFAVTRAEVYPVFSGEAFGSWLATTARELGMRTFIPSDATAMMANGSVVAVGDVEVQFGRADRTGRTSVERVVLMRAGTGGGDPAWSMEPESRAARVLRDALRLVLQDMINRDERVQKCMGSVEARSVERATQLSCVADVLASDFGEG